MKNLVVVCVGLLFTCGNVQAQNFTLSDTLLRMVAPHSDFAFYTWFEITNHSGQDLNLRWVRSYDTPYPTPWDNNMQVLDTNYANHVDSADFVLPAVAGWSDYLLCFNFPNNHHDSARIRITVYDPLNPSDRVSGVYEYVTYFLSGLPNPIEKERNLVFPNPVHHGTINIDEFARNKYDKILFITSDGRIAREFQITSKGVDVGDLSNGMYTLILYNSATRQRASTRLSIINTK